MLYILLQMLIKLIDPSYICYAPSGFEQSWLSTMSCPIYFLANFVFFLSLLSPVLPSIYASSLGRLYVAFFRLSFPSVFVNIKFSKVSSSFQLSLSDVKYRRCFCFHIFCLLKFRIWVEWASFSPYDKYEEKFQKLQTFFFV